MTLDVSLPADAASHVAFAAIAILATVVVAIGVRVAIGFWREWSRRFRVEVVPRFFTRAEHAFYSDLVEIADDLDLVVFPKVGLKDLFRDRPGARKGQFFRYAQLHVDFLLVRPGDFRPVLGIELDGESHLAPIQRERDEKKNEVFRAAGLPLVRFQNGARARDVRDRLVAMLRRGVPR